MKKLIITIVATLLMLFSTVNAEQSIYKDCGIGAMLFSGEDERNRSAASIVNIIWDWGTTANLSYVSGTCVRGNDEIAAAIFIHETYSSLVEETAKGNGEHLTGMLNIMNVDEASRTEAIATLQSSLATTVSSPEYNSLTKLEKSEAYFSILEDAI